MKSRIFRQTVLTVACLGMVIPQYALAETVSRAHISDVALRSGGTLVGQLVDSQGRPQGASVVSVQTAGREVARTLTDEQGRFVARGLRGGVYQVATTGGVSSYRVWAEGTAPPAAQQGVLMAHDPVIRGAHGQHGGIGAFLSNPWVLAGIVATAIAVPIAVNDDNDGS